MGYERVLIWFDTLRALRNLIPVELPSGEVVQVNIEYERVRKRTFQCKRLTHDKSRCPLNPLNRHIIATRGFNLVAERVVLHISKISPDDPVYEVLTDNDVGINLNTGKTEDC
ncbi:hypothetical protein V5N11_034666 [Cardamine amara subsp. amara]|uniref:Zinc knuckle CX2CX4HX4C domain-containing protein n=1 Tax=Cardamine amara subsp. amara TaxID=228776 RepID=A0ABD1AC88_CARAN